MKLTNQQKEIRKNALLIAKFEGFQVEEKSIYGSIFYSDDNERTAIDTAYHNSERWLKPVSDKIDEILFENIGKFGYSDECLHSDDLEVRYIAVVEFIEWYNKEINLDK